MRFDLHGCNELMCHMYNIYNNMTVYLLRPDYMAEMAKIFVLFLHSFSTRPYT